MQPIKVKPIKVQALKHEFDRKEFVIPKFQRKFVWNRQNVCSLIDSVCKNYPIGSILYWETDNKHIFKTLRNLPDFNNDNNYSLYKSGIKVGVGELNRYFIKIPAGGTSLSINLSSDRNTYSKVWFFLNKPSGPRIGMGFLSSDKNYDSTEKKYFNLKPGVYELDVMGYYRGAKESTYNLSVHFEGISRIDNSNLSRKNNNIQIVNYYDDIKTYNVSGVIDSYSQEFSAELYGGDHYKIPFNIVKGENSKEFSVKMSKENFNKVTDFALMIYDKDGKAVSIGGLSYDKGSVRISNNFKADTTNLTFVMIPGFTFKSDSMNVSVIKKTVLSHVEKFKVTHNKKRDRKSTRLNSSHTDISRMPSSA